MDIEVSSGADGVVPKLEDPPVAAAAEPWPPAREKQESRRRRVLLASGVMALLLLAFFVLGARTGERVDGLEHRKCQAHRHEQY
ncbi:unnamed protein product [Urochloa humidicola]